MCPQLNRKAVEEGRQKKCDKQAKTELSKQTFEMDAMQKKLESVKAQLGEGERVNTNKTRETIETRKQAEQAKKDEFGTGRFRQDEALHLCAHRPCNRNLGAASLQA